MKTKLLALLIIIAITVLICSCQNIPIEQEKECSHQWEEATCVSPKKCFICKETEGVALGHTYVVDEAVDATCTSYGYTEGKHCSLCGKILQSQTILPPQHSGGIATCTSKATCDFCGEIYGDLLAHNYSEEVISEKYLSTPATCKNSAYYYKSCVCGKKGVGIFSYGSTLEHTVVVDDAIVATCSSTGLTQGTHCSDCGSILIRQNIIPKNNNHTSINGTCANCYVICNPYDALAYYVFCNGKRNDDGEYFIMDAYFYDGGEYYYYIYTDSTASTLSFRSLSYTESAEVFVMLDINSESNLQEAFMGMESLGYTDYAYGKIDGSTFSSSNKTIYSYQYEGDFPSLASNVKTVFASHINLLLVEINRVLLVPMNVDITMEMLGFDNY